MNNKVPVRLTKQPRQYELSHYYKRTDSADPCVSSENSFSSEEEAARGALRSATMFYRSTDEGGTWVKSESFIQ